MTAPLLLACTLLTVALLVLARRFRRLRAVCAGLEQALSGLGQATAEVPPALLETVAGDDGRRLVIRILNPIELASRQSWLASTFGSVAAPLVRRQVYEQALPIVIAEMKKHGVEAEVTVQQHG